MQKKRVEKEKKENNSPVVLGSTKMAKWISANKLLESAYLKRISKTQLELSSSNGTERFPFSYDEARHIWLDCQAVGIKLRFEPKLKEWLKAETAKHDNYERRKKEWEFECIPFESSLGQALSHRNFQRQGVEFAIQNKDILIADEAGLGKTLEAIGAIVEANITGSILIVAPKTAAYVTWPAELARWLPEVAPYDEWIIIGGKMTQLERVREVKRVIRWDLGKGRIGPRQWVVVSPNYLRLKPKVDYRGRFVYDDNGEKIIKPVREAFPALLTIDWAAIIVDECHQTLSGAAGEIKNQSAQRQGLGLLSIQENGLRIAMSGTPFRGKHENLWGTLNWLRPNDFRAYWSWVYNHFWVYQDYNGVRQVGGLRDEKKFAEEVKNLMIRRTKAEVAPELPQKLYGGTPLWPNKKDDQGPVAVWLEMFGPQKKSYESMAAQAMAELEGGTLMANGVLAEMVRLKQFADSHGFIGAADEFFPNFPSNKFDWLLDFFEDRGIDGNGPGESKVIVASQFTKIINLFAKRLKEKLSIPCFVLTGETNEKERERIQREFQRGRSEDGGPVPDVVLLNTKAGGTSLTLDAADDVVILDQTFNSDDQLQVEDRAHRISRVHHVNIWYLASQNSIDESIARHTYRMETSIKKILDGERGMDFAKILLRDAM